LGAMSFPDCAAEMAKHFVGDAMSKADLLTLCRDAYDFQIPLKTFGGDELDTAMTEEHEHFMLELFHGPTLAFKDFAARFMARGVSHLLKGKNQKRTILVATSGDTGGAIGYAFKDLPRVKVVILYPEGGVSQVQEQQLTTIGEHSNVRALRVKGSFDDCQALVKQAFADEKMTKRFSLMSANSINVGRVVPQSFYYFWTSLQLKAAYPKRPLVYAIPSGNLGNLTGGLMAKLMGAPIDRFVAGHNVNDPFVDYLQSGKYKPRPSVLTLSNAMDIGRPNNFPRITTLFGDDHKAVQDSCWGASFSDAETERHMRRIYSTTGYVMCPHTTIGNLALQSFMRDVDQPVTQVTVSTAHAGKFQSDVNRILREDLPLPAPLAELMSKTSHVQKISNQLTDLESFLAGFAA